MNNAPYDAIVVGSGAGGAAATYALAEAGMNVLLLEKGAPLPDDNSTLDVQKVVRDGMFLSREPWLDRHGRGLIPEEHFNLGGKTCWYGAALLRFAPHEFAEDAPHQCRQWPLAYADFKQYYERAESLLGVSTFGCEHDLAAIVNRLERRGDWLSLPLPMGLDATIINHPLEARRFDGFASVARLKSDARTAFLDRVTGRPNLAIMTDAPVHTLLAARDNPARIAGVRLTDGREFSARYVLLAAGALHSPRILQRFVRNAGLDTRLPAAANIGRNLKLHLLTALLAVSSGRKSDVLRKTTILLNDEFPHSSIQPLGFDADLIETLVPRYIPRAVARFIGRRAYGFFLQTEDGSHPDNRVSDAPIADGSPLLDYSAHRLPAARLEHRELCRQFQRDLRRARIASLTQNIGLQGTAHVCGTLMMGDDPARSVVDSAGQVHGMPGLFVVDGSVLPRSSRVNPSLTIYAWGLRVADLLVRNQKKTAGALLEEALI